MKILATLLFSLATMASYAIPPSAETVKNNLGAVNAISISKYSTENGKINNLTCADAEIQATNSCNSGGAYIVLGSDYSTKLYLYNCNTSNPEKSLVDCGEI